MLLLVVELLSGSEYLTFPAVGDLRSHVRADVNSGSQIPWTTLHLMIPTACIIRHIILITKQLNTAHRLFHVARLSASAGTPHQLAFWPILHLTSFVPRFSPSAPLAMPIAR